MLPQYSLTPQKIEHRRKKLIEKFGGLKYYSYLCTDIKEIILSA